MIKKTEELDRTALIDRIKMLEEDLRKEKDMNKKFNHIFVSKVNHEIRTPLNSVLGFANLLGNDKIEGYKRKLYVKYLNSSTESLLFRIENLLDYAMLAVGQLELIEEKDQSLDYLFVELYETFLLEKQFQEKNKVTLLLRKKEGTGEIVANIDRRRLKKMLSILLANALQGTRKGNIEFGYELVDNEHIRFYVSDSADQYRTEYIRKIFEEKNLSGMTQKDTDINLSLVRDLVRFMGGEIDIAAKPGGKGNVVSFIMPVHYRIRVLNEHTGREERNNKKYLND